MGFVGQGLPACCGPSFFRATSSTLISYNSKIVVAVGFWQGSGCFYVAGPRVKGLGFTWGAGV